MSQERFDWLERWVADPADIIRTPGTESNVKEIYDRCAELDARPGQRHLQPVLASSGTTSSTTSLTGRALERVVESLPDARAATCGRAPSSRPPARPGTIGAGDYLKERLGTRIVAVEALECPTMLENGFGEHNIQGIGDKHIPLIHNVMNTDIVVGDLRPGHRPARSSCSTPTSGATTWPTGAACPRTLVDGARRRSACRASATCWPRSRSRASSGLGPGRRDRDGRHRRRGDVRGPSSSKIAARATSPAASTRWPPARRSARTCWAPAPDHVLELTRADRDRIFNLGYFTWVEQQGVAARRVRGAPRARRSGPRSARSLPRLGRADRGVQRARSGAAVAA